MTIEEIKRWSLSEPPAVQQYVGEMVGMVERLEEYLGRIADPVWWMQEDLIREGKSRSELNGAMAISLSNNASYLRDIARAALRQRAEDGK